jgi:hypothetical protein
MNLNRQITKITNPVIRLINRKRTLPSFLIIGAQKAGTVALVNYLRKHPLLSSPRKEVNYFNTNNYKLGLDWYSKQFNPSLKKTFYFEKTPEYIYYPEAPERIKKFNPDIKMIAILREPVERAFSGWNHYKKYFFNEPNYSKELLIKRLLLSESIDQHKPMVDFLNRRKYPEFEEIVEEEMDLINNNIFQYNPSFVRRGIYSEQIGRYYRYFDKSQLLILDSNELIQNPNKTMNQVYNFLEVTDYVSYSDSYSIEHSSEYKGKRIEEKVKKRLKEFYKPYNEKLFELINKQYNWD